ncbi:MAG: hypothetical protein AAGF83_23495 [Cyanobacteria bacterium P01_G01_bin.67]
MSRKDVMELNLRRKKILAKFLTREGIYYTDYFYYYLDEVAAQANLTSEIT